MAFTKIAEHQGIYEKANFYINELIDLSSGDTTEESEVIEATLYKSIDFLISLSDEATINLMVSPDNSTWFTLDSKSEEDITDTLPDLFFYIGPDNTYPYIKITVEDNTDTVNVWATAKGWDVNN